MSFMSFFYVLDLCKGCVPKIVLKSLNSNVIDGLTHSVIDFLSFYKDLGCKEKF